MLMLHLRLVVLSRRGQLISKYTFKELANSVIYGNKLIYREDDNIASLVTFILYIV